jgi:hypothetical protein
VDNCGKPGRDFAPEGGMALRACSACAGDYEDPDRTAPPDEDGEAGAPPDRAEEGTGAGFLGYR